MRLFEDDVKKFALLIACAVLGFIAWGVIRAPYAFVLAPSEFVLGDGVCPRFRIPANLDAEMTKNRSVVWFTVRYPAMTPNTVAYSGGQGAIKIWLAPYPKNGTALAEAILGGKFSRYHLENSSGDYETLTLTDSKTGAVTVSRLFRDPDGNAISFTDIGKWGATYMIEHGDRALGYTLRASVSKKVVDDPIFIDQKLTALVRSMLVSSACIVK
jgi:hypothetical protein